MISKVSRIDTECIWYNDPELTKNPITETNLHKRQALIYMCGLKTWDYFTCLLDSIMSFLDFSQCIYFYVTIAYEFFVMLTWFIFRLTCKQKALILTRKKCLLENLVSTNKSCKMWMEGNLEEMEGTFHLLHFQK